ncbi:MAG: YfhO family protein [Candidatus Hydrogenedentota bacterium]|nr:MAG: YfhO family protein [Candidatus Hydrogenedentota bacterium]
MSEKRRSLLSSYSPDNVENFSFYAALVATALILFLLGLPLIQGHVYKHDDLSRYHLPFRFFFAQCLAAGDSFIWLPNIFCGLYLHGEGQMGMYHPLHLILYSTLPLGAAFNIELLLSYPFMMVGMFLFLRRWKIPRTAGMLGALVFALSGFNLLHYMHMNAIAVAAHIPWLLLAIDVALRGTSGPQVACARLGITLLTASQLLLGHPTTFWLSSVVEVMYVLLLASSWKAGRRLLSLGAAKMFGVLVGSVQLLPHWDAASTSVRQHSSLASRMWPSLHPMHIAQSVAPYFFNDFFFEGIPYELKIYNGAIPLALLTVLLIRRKELGTMRPLAMGALGLGAFSLVFALGEYGYLYRLQTLLPLVGLLRTPCRYILLLHLVTAVVAAIAFADISELTRQGDRLAWRRLSLLMLVPLMSVLPLVFLLWAKLHPHQPLGRYLLGNVTTKNLIIAGPVLLTLASVIVAMASRGKRYALVGIILFAAMDQGAYGLSYIWKNEPGADIKGFTEFAPTPPEASQYRVLSDNNVWVMKGVRIAKGYVSIRPEKQLDGLSEAYRKVAGVRWVWDRDKQLLYRLYGKVSGWELPRPLLRARLVSKVLVSSDPNKDIDTIDVESTALVSEEIELPGGQAGKATIVSDRPGRIAVVTDAGSKQLLVLSESYHEGWQATVDGEESPVMRAYGDFMGCVLAPGTHKVEFRFRPRSLRMGGWVSALGLGLMSVSFFLSVSPRGGRREIRKDAA